MKTYNVGGKILTEADLDEGQKAFRAIVKALKGGVEALRGYEKARADAVEGIGIAVATLERFLMGHD